jgi:hypothetical protein
LPKEELASDNSYIQLSLNNRLIILSHYCRCPWAWLTWADLFTFFLLLQKWLTSRTSTWRGLLPLNNIRWFSKNWTTTVWQELEKSTGSFINVLNAVLYVNYHNFCKQNTFNSKYYNSRYVFISASGRFFTFWSLSFLTPSFGSWPLTSTSARRRITWSQTLPEIRDNCHCVERNNKTKRFMENIYNAAGLKCHFRGIITGEQNYWKKC